MDDKDKKLLSKVLSKEELLEIMVEALKEDRKIFSNSKKLWDLVLSNLEKKEDEVFDEQQRILQEQSNVKTMNKKFFELIAKYEKLNKKLKLLEECRSVLYERRI